jgi:glycosyltransferase involved in cell wall biosynthesis
VALVASLGALRRVIYHEHDEPLTDPDRHRESAFVRIVRYARMIIARNASLCVIPQAERLREFVKATSRRGPVACVWNCPRGADASVDRDYTEPMTVLYHGTIVPDRLPRAVLVALSQLKPRTRLRVVGYETIGHIGYSAELRALCEQLGISERVDFRGPAVTRAELLSWARECHVGLALMPRKHRDVNLTHMAGASNKPFDYMACGLAFVVSDLPAWREMYVNDGFATACDPESVDSLVKALSAFIDDPQMVQTVAQENP